MSITSDRFTNADGSELEVIPWGPELYVFIRELTYKRQTDPVPWWIVKSVDLNEISYVVGAVQLNHLSVLDPEREGMFIIYLGGEILVVTKAMLIQIKKAGSFFEIDSSENGLVKPPKDSKIPEEPQFEFVTFNRRRNQRGADAAQIRITYSGGEKEILWMSRRDLQKNYDQFGESVALLEAMEAYGELKKGH